MNRMQTLKTIIGKLFLIALATSSTAAATPYASVKALGMGSAAVAYGQDAITAFYNPATAGEIENRADIEAIARWDRKETDLSNRGTVGAAGLITQTGNFKTKDPWTEYGSFGINYRLGCYDEWALGVQWNNDYDIHTRYNNAFADFGTSNLKFDYRVEALTFTSAYNYDCNNTFGIGLNVYFSWLTVNGLDRIGDPLEDFSIDPAFVSNNGREEASGVGFTLGWLGRFCDDRLSLGLTWGPRVRMGGFRQYKGFLPVDHLDLPETWRAGFAYRDDWTCTTFAADFEYRRWSRCVSWHNHFAGDAPGIIVFAPLFGTSTGPGFGWSDQSIVKLGWDYAFDSCLTVRLGYRYEQSPIRHRGPDTALNVLTANVIENYVTCGATYNLDPCTEISYFFEWGIQGHKDSRYPEIGNVDISTFNSGDLRFKDTSYAFGLSYGQSY